MHPSDITSSCQPFWRYGLFTINSELLVESNISSDSESIYICGRPVALTEFDQIIVVGAGKAGSGMAKGLLKALSNGKVPQGVNGLVCVPDNCVEDLDGIRLHGGRPAGLNEPTAQGQQGAEEILKLVKSAGPRDLVICLISGGGSALTPLPVESVSLESKKNVTRFLSQQGASINELNAVRSSISQIKGGGLVRDFAGHSLHSLIISDVLGNPLQTIASGMTVPQDIDYQAALDTIKKYDPQETQIAPSIIQAITNRANHISEEKPPHPENVFNNVIGDNATCVDAIANMASQLGYEVKKESALADEGPVEQVAEHLFQEFKNRVERSGFPRPFCFVSGGEPTVQLKNTKGKGGRNQHLALLMLDKIRSWDLPDNLDFEFVALGTDGEDGPTDAAGALVNREILVRTETLGLSTTDHIDQNNAYLFFEQNSGLIKTGPTHTNVCDIRVLVIVDSAN